MHERRDGDHETRRLLGVLGAKQVAVLDQCTAGAVGVTIGATAKGEQPQAVAAQKWRVRPHKCAWKPRIRKVKEHKVTDQLL